MAVTCPATSDLGAQLVVHQRPGSHVSYRQRLRARSAALREQAGPVVDDSPADERCFGLNLLDPGRLDRERVRREDCQVGELAGGE